MTYPDIDRLLREERFEELGKLGAIPANRLLARRSFRERMLARLRFALSPARGAVGGSVTIRHARPEDRVAVARLAEMEERRPPSGAVLVAEIENQILAALPLDGSVPVAHPLRPTAGLIDLLELRSRQLEREGQLAAA